MRIGCIIARKSANERNEPNSSRFNTSEMGCGGSQRTAMADTKELILLRCDQSIEKIGSANAERL
jgi:hypothetical protein